MRALLPSTSRKTDIPEADVPPRKRACLTTVALGFEVEESFATGSRSNFLGTSPRSPHTIIPLSQTRIRRVRKIVRLEPSMSESMEACIARYDA
nr:hypothetical protein [Tanacetum cinerariifolium]